MRNDEIRVLLVGCGKAKAAEALPARELYVGGLFRDRRGYAEREVCDERAAGWWIVSALHGLVDPFEVVRPYDRTMADLLPIDRAAWALDVAHHLLNELAYDDECLAPARLVVELHAGLDYVEPLASVLRGVGARVELPVEGLGLPAQRAWYRDRRIYSGSTSPPATNLGPVPAPV